jgi:tetratricopeptide (TPR) repeat protein
VRRAVPLLLAWLALTGAAPLPLQPPLPDLTGLVPWATAPLDKPALRIARPPLPPPPVEMPSLPPAVVVLPAAPRPWALMPPPRVLPCAGAWLGLPSESLECGRARLVRGEWEEAARALEVAARGGDPGVQVEARYWLAEVYYRLGRVAEADGLFRQVAADRAAVDMALWGLHGSGWTALRLGDAARAREAFARLLSVPHPAAVDAWSRHGLGLAHYALGQFEEAARVWADLQARRTAAGFERDVLFWRAEALARAGRLDEATASLQRFIQGPSHPLVPSAHLRLGWWSLQAGKTNEALAAFRTYLAPPPGVALEPAERDWAEAGLALTLVAAGDWNAASPHLARLAERRSPLAVPVRMHVAVAALEHGQGAVALGLAQELLAAPLAPAARAWALLLKGDAYLAEGNRDEARTQYDLARDIDPASPAGRLAALRQAQVNFELREFQQVLRDVAPVTSPGVAADLRVPALMLQGEAAYHAGDWTTAGESYRRLLVEFPGDPQASAVRMALAWTALREGRAEAARAQFLEVAGARPRTPHAGDALLLAAEIALQRGQLAEGRDLLERIIKEHRTSPRAEFAWLNRAILMLREGQVADAQRELGIWVRQNRFSPLLGRALTALGVALLADGRPADAARELAAAQREGGGDLANLGLGVAALAAGRIDEAAQRLREVRDGGAPALAPVADYALAVVALARGDTRPFRSAGRAMLDAAPASAAAPRLLYVLAGLAAQEGDWPAALDYARRLVTDFPADEAADDALERVGRAAAEAGAWPVVHEAYSLLHARYPQSPFVPESRLALALAQMELGRPGDARRVLEDFVRAAPSDPRGAEAWIRMARARQAVGDQAGALEAYDRAARYGSASWSPEMRLAYARLLSGARRWAEARTAWEPILRQSDPALAAEAALAIGEAHAAERDHAAATEYFLSAAYLAPDSPAGQRALLLAARSLAAQRQPEAAATVYRKLLARPGAPADLVQAARQGLAEIRR